MLILDSPERCTENKNKCKFTENTLMKQGNETKHFLIWTPIRKNKNKVTGLTFNQKTKQTNSIYCRMNKGLTILA